MSKDKVVKLTREEFFEKNPPSERGIRIMGPEGVTFIPVGDLIVCDFCNAEIYGDIHLFSNNALCESCAKNVGKGA
jgi:hypothetical protein